MAGASSPMNLWSRTIDRVEAWFFDPVPLQPMVASRIILGGILVASYLIRWPAFSRLYGEGSIAWFPQFRSYVASVIAPPLDGLVALVDGAGVQAYVWMAYALLLVASLAFCVGFLTRWVR